MWVWWVRSSGGGIMHFLFTNVLGLWTVNTPVNGEILGRIAQDPNVSKSNQLHVDFFQIFLDESKYIPYIPLKWSVIGLKSWNWNGSFSNSVSQSVTNGWISPFIGLQPRFEFTNHFVIMCFIMAIQEKVIIWNPAPCIGTTTWHNLANQRWKKSLKVYWCK